MGTEWSPAEDMRPGVQMFRVQPESTHRGKVWTQLVWFELDGSQYYTQLKIRECSGDILVEHGRIWPVTTGEKG